MEREDVESPVGSCDSSEASDVAVELRSAVPAEVKPEAVSPELQAEMLNQFLHVLSELDEVLDASLLQDLELDNPAPAAAPPPLCDDDDVVCPTAPPYQDMPHYLDTFHSEEYHDAREEWERVDPEYLQHFERHTSEPGSVLYEPSQPLSVVGQYRELGNSIGTTDVQDRLGGQSDWSGERDDARGSMRRLEPLTLPVLLFLEHHVNMRPSSAPLELQRSEHAENEGRRTVVGRHSLLPASPGSPARWTTSVRTDAGSARSSRSSSSDSSECLQLPVVTHLAQIGGESAEETPGTAGGAEDEQEEDAWPHALSPTLACLSCTVGLFNISRFAVFSVHFGFGWVLQWVILSLCVGLPLLALHASLGRVLASGALDMWRVSPVLRGVGAALLAAQLLLAAYSVLGVSWLLLYFRDSFVTTDDAYRWALPFTEGGRNFTRLQESIPRYWDSEVLQRSSPPPPGLGAVKFQTAFNLSVVWMIVFVALSKGLRSYGKAVYVLVLAPACGAVVLATKLLTLASADARADLLSQTQWREFFVNTNSWAAAAQETFLTWGLFGASVMQTWAHARPGARSARALRRAVACVAAATFALLLLAALLANVCVLVLRQHGYLYLPSSYESITSGQFLWLMSEPLPPSLASTPVRYMGHYSSVVGLTVWRPPGDAAHSGWQPLQLATQLVPATLAVLTARELSPVWAVIFYFMLILLGTAQQLAAWHGVVTGVVAINRKMLRPWKTSITFFSCIVGLLTGLVLATDGGVHVVHWLDYVVTGAWWQCLLHALLVCGVFLVRGRPYSGDAVVVALFPADSGRFYSVLAAMLSFMWTLVLPVLLIAICVVDFRAGRQRQLYSWRRATGTPSGYWGVWARQCAAALQQGALLLVPLVAAVQTYRYMNKGPEDVLERIQSLYRPRLGEDGRPAAPPEEATPTRAPAAAPAPDPPPKYTPPPSYSTATGARLLATLRRSFRAVRRLTTSLGDTHTRDDGSQLPITLSESVESGATEGAERRARISRGSLSLRRSGGGGGRLRSSLRKSFKFAARSDSREQLARGAEPPSSTVAMTAVVTRDTL